MIVRALIIFVLCAGAAVVLARFGRRSFSRGHLDRALMALAASTGLMAVALFALSVGVLS